MRILFVALGGSIHAARWINQLAGEGWELHLFPSVDARVHPALRNVTVHDHILSPLGLKPRAVFLPGTLALPWSPGVELGERALKRLRRLVERLPGIKERSRRLARVIERIKPDIVHSLEIQHAGYLTLAARDLLEGDFPPWIVTNWGSDIYLFGRQPEHAQKIRAVLSACDYYACECQRDVTLARTFGFKGEVLPVLPNAGGFDLELAGRFRQPGAVSARRLVVLKGYQSWAGRGLVALKAIELCAEVLQGYRVAVYLATPDVRHEGQRVSRAANIPLDVIPRSPHEEILRLHGRARVSIGLSVSDAISTSFLEALVMGAFPIQSNTACADEWIVDGEGGLLVPPEDPEVVASALRRAITDDDLVDRAAERNACTVAKRLVVHDIKRQVIATYNKIAEENQKA